MGQVCGDRMVLVIQLKLVRVGYLLQNMYGVGFKKAMYWLPGT